MSASLSDRGRGRGRCRCSRRRRRRRRRRPRRRRGRHSSSAAACLLAGWLAGVLSPRAASVLDRLLATSPAWAHLVPCRCGAAAIVLQYIQASVPALLRAQRSWGS